MNHGTYLSTSVQEMDLASLSDPQRPLFFRESRHVPLSQEELKHLMEYRSLIDGDGFCFRRTGFSEDEADDHLEASRQFRVSLRRNAQHFKAWQAQESSLTELKLDDHEKILEGESPPHSLTDPDDHLEASRQFRINLRQNKEHVKAWQTQEVMLTSTTLDRDGMPHVCGHLTFQEQAKKDRDFVPYTTCLNTILLSDGRWQLSLDDVMQVMNDVTTELVGLHAASIPYGDMRVDNIYVTDLMRAFLIKSDKSKRQENDILLTEEFQRDMKLFCKIMGGMYNFYIRNKPPEPPEDINKEAEKSVSSLLKRGYKDAISAKDLVEELGLIVVSGLIGDEPVEAPRPEPQMEEKKKSGLGQATGDNAPEPKSEAMDDQSLELDSGAVKNQGSVPGAASFFDDQGLLPRSAAVDNQVSNPNSGTMDVKGKQPVPEPEAVKPSCEVISTPVLMPEAGTMNYNALEPSPEATSTPASVPEASAVSMVLSGLGPGSEGCVAVSNQAPEIGSFADQGAGNEPGDDVSRSLELQSAELEVEDHNLDREFPDQGSTHEQLMSDLEMDVYFSASDNSIYMYHDAGN